MLCVMALLNVTLDDVIFARFFFQAGGGIRDRNVTGVQTCALPILPHENRQSRGRIAAGLSDRRKLSWLAPDQLSAPARSADGPRSDVPDRARPRDVHRRRGPRRSEERRAGKEL